ncbi:MAG TPA: hypothetical protein VK464_24595 [Symbiobacteriaceae bacterium]|jgi:hypothetical protein|nr:hypothetical protein [Symbiobacteriaceae bacterium]
MWKRVVITLVLVGLVGGGYWALPTLASLPALPDKVSTGLAGTVRATLVDLSTEAAIQQALALGRARALDSPDVRQTLFAQTLAEQRAMAADKEELAEMLDLELSLLEKASETSPHDRRLARLLVELLETAAKDPTMRPALEASLRQVLQQAPAR